MQTLGFLSFCRPFTLHIEIRSPKLKPWQHKGIVYIPVCSILLAWQYHTAWSPELLQEQLQKIGRKSEMLEEAECYPNSFWWSCDKGVGVMWKSEMVFSYIVPTFLWYTMPPKPYYALNPIIPKILLYLKPYYTLNTFIPLTLLYPLNLFYP